MGCLEGGNCLYLNVSKGFFKNKAKKIATRGYTGYFISIDCNNDNIGYNDKPAPQIIVKMKDDKTDEVALIQFIKKTWYAHTFFARIQNIDLTKPFTIGCSNSDENEKLSFCWMKQDGKKIEKENLLKPTKTTVGDDDVTDWTEVLPLMDEIMFNLNAAEEAPETAKKSEPAGPAMEPEIKDDNQAAEGDDDLPF